MIATQDLQLWLRVLRMLRALDAHGTGLVSQVDLRYAFGSVLGQKQVSAGQMVVMLDGFAGPADRSVMAAVSRKHRTCRYTDMMRALSPAVALLADEKAGVAPLQQDRQDVLYVACCLARALHAPLCRLSSALAERSTTFVSGPVVPSNSFQVACQAAIAPQAVSASEMRVVLSMFASTGAGGVQTDTFLTAVGVSIERAMGVALSG